MKCYYYVFCKESLLLEQNSDGIYSIPFTDEPPTKTKPWTTILHVAQLNGHDVKAYSLDLPSQDNSSFSPEVQGKTFIPLRQSYYQLPQEHYLMAGKCAELLYWHQNTRFCGVCGGSMKFHTHISKRCEQCGKEVWPQLAPAVIVLIHKGPDEVLLARGRSFRTDFYGLIAGFVETGENLEQAVYREVHEETGLSIHNLRYFGSQPWPYPSGLMVGYHADYLNGMLRLQHEELCKAAWFHRDNLPRLPEKLSIARKLIDDWLNNS